jgi:hypothetical protein
MCHSHHLNCGDVIVQRSQNTIMVCIAYGIHDSSMLASTSRWCVWNWLVYHSPFDAIYVGRRVYLLQMMSRSETLEYNSWFPIMVATHPLEGWLRKQSATVPTLVKPIGSMVQSVLWGNSSFELIICCDNHVYVYFQISHRMIFLQYWNRWLIGWLTRGKNGMFFLMRMKVQVLLYLLLMRVSADFHHEAHKKQKRYISKEPFNGHIV